MLGCYEMVHQACYTALTRITAMDSDAEISAYNGWSALDEQITTLKSASDSVAKGILKLKSSMTEGSVGTFQDSAQKLQAKLDEMNSKISDIGNQLSAFSLKTEEIRDSVERLCKDQKLSEHIFKTGTYLIVFPLVVRFEKKTDVTRITVGSTTTTSIRPDYIVKLIKEALELPFNPKVFLKSLQAAYGLLKRSERQHEVSLEDIRQLISISYDSTSKLSVEQFEALLQRLYANSDSDLKDQLPQFVPVAAASQSYLLFKKDGSSISVGSISLEVINLK